MLMDGCLKRKKMTKIKELIKKIVEQSKIYKKNNQTIFFLIILGMIARLIGLFISLKLIKYILDKFDIEYKRKK